MQTATAAALVTVMLSAWLAGLAAAAGGLIAWWEGSAETEGKREFVHGVVAFGGGVLVAAVAFALTPLGLEVLSAPVLGTVFVAGGLVFCAPHARMQRHWTPALGAVLGFAAAMVGKQMLG